MIMEELMRKTIYLNGAWNFMPDYKAQDPEKLVTECVWEKEKIMVPSSWKWALDNGSDYEPYDLFYYPKHWNEAGSGILERNFEVSHQANERIFLIFEGVFQNWQVFINDVCVLQSQEAFLPVEVDITNYVHLSSSNSLKVWCGPFKTIDTPLGKKQIGLIGSWFAQDSIGIWQDVRLEYRNKAYLLNPVVRTSYKENTIEAEVNVVGLGVETVRFTLWDGVQKIKSFDGKLQREENGVLRYTNTIDWKDAILWMPEQPHLYELKAELLCNDEIIDTLNTPFGFREVWFEANYFYLNGIRINLRGDSWHYQGFAYQTKAYALNWFKMCKDVGMNFVRLHAMPYPEFFLDAADEVGMLIIDESAIYGSSKKMQADHPKFIENCKSHLEILVKRDRNHPSIIMWSMQNEMRWVDGRDGYKLQMKQLIAVMKSLDATRAISFDGDNRLVAPEDMEVVSMHYNIDGTVASWDKSKPLAFGEHGKWHYVSPQVACSFVGNSSYESIDSCLLNMGTEEALFTEYARKEDVTALCPFNVGYYMMRPMPEEDVQLTWTDTTGPGVKPKVIKKYSLTINNGLLKNEPIYKPNASFELIKKSMQPITIFADEYDSSFFEGTALVRNFSVYNDTYAPQNVRLNYRLKKASGEIIKDGSASFYQLPGSRNSINLSFILPSLKTESGDFSPEIVSLHLDLFHQDEQVFSHFLEYRVYECQTTFTKTIDKKILYIGDPQDYENLKAFTGSILHQGELSLNALKDIDLVILGRNCKTSMKALQVVLMDYVTAGGFLLIMEQDKEAPGELVLSGRKYPNALIVDQRHPIFKGLTDDDFSNWRLENANVPGGYSPVINAFEKPVSGDLKVLLECGDGDFGWGGLLWAAMLEYQIGAGSVLLQQLDLTGKLNELPQASVLLRNILEYAFTKETVPYCKTGILAVDNSSCVDFLKKTGLDFQIITQSKLMNDLDLIIVEPQCLEAENAADLMQFVQSGGKLLVLPMNTTNTHFVETIAGCSLSLIDKAIYQVKSTRHPLTEGISPFDCYHFENVTYTPADKVNSVIAEQALQLAPLEKLLTNIQTPWEDMYVKDLAAEQIKQATLQISKDRPFEELCICGILELGEGKIMLSQLKLTLDNDKLIRLYSRLLVNLGAEIKTNLLTYVKEEKDFGISTFMALPYEKHNDFELEQAYFSHPEYVLNNLGEGVYGWMNRVEKKNGFITIEASAGSTYFLTLFLQSDLNRNPLKRAAGELPDSSIVPDLLLSVNCDVHLFINGTTMFEKSNVSQLEDFKIEDITLNKGLNRVTLVCFGGAEDIKFNMCFIHKYGDFINDLKYQLTMD